MEDPVQKPPVSPTDQVASVRREIENAGVLSHSISHSEQAPNIPAEVREAGVEATVLAPNLTREHFDVGIRHSPEASRPDLEKTPVVSYSSLTSQIQVLNQTSVEDSGFWLKRVLIKVRQGLSFGGLKKVTV